MSDQELEKRKQAYNWAFWIAIVLTFFLLFISCNSYQALKNEDCEASNLLPISSQLLQVTYSEARREIYINTKLALADNTNTFLQDIETCEKIPVAMIQRKRGITKLTFVLTELQFTCYMKSVNEANITYYTRKEAKI